MRLKGQTFGGYTIYDSPSDAPGSYVLRGWTVDETGRTIFDGGIATEHTEHALNVIRRSLIDDGLICSPREPDDDPCIIESWI